MQVSGRTAGRAMAPASSRVRSVQVRAMLDKKPERVVEPPKKLFDAAPAAATTTATAPQQPIKPASPAQPLQALPKGAVVTVEYQRQRAKEITKYFKELKLNEAIVKAQVFGWTRSNEISNGRWVMFGLLVGMLTEYATGVDFPDQLKLMCSYLGIIDIE